MESLSDSGPVSIKEEIYQLGHKLRAVNLQIRETHRILETQAAIAKEIKTKLEEVSRWQEGENSESRRDTRFVDKKKKKTFSGNHAKSRDTPQKNLKECPEVQ
eukprot:663689-Ditylum_brightwellii.AAC.1